MTERLKPSTKVVAGYSNQNAY